MAFKETKRKGFNFFRSYYDVYNELESDSDKVAFINALLDRQFLGIKPNDLKGLSRFAWISQVNSIDSQVKGYEDKTKSTLLHTVNTPYEGGPVGGGVGGGEPPTEQVQVQVQGEEKEQVKEKDRVKPLVYSKEVHDCLNKCLLFFDEHLRPTKESILHNWLDTIDKLNRLDDISFEVIEQITKAARQDDFWSRNFLSLTKLRNKDKNGLMYIVVFNEKLKNNGKGKQTITAFIHEQHKNDTDYKAM